MPKYRTVEPVSYVEDGGVVSVKADRTIELSEDDAKKLAGKILLVENKTPSMFPNGSPYIPVHIVRPHEAKVIAGEAVAPESKKVAPVKVQPKVDVKPESK